MNLTSSNKILVGSILTGFLGGLMGGVVVNSTIQANLLQPNISTNAKNEQSQPVQKPYSEDTMTIDSIKKVSPAVVSIVESQSLKVYQRTTGNPLIDIQPNSSYDIVQQKIGGGTGFIISDDGVVLTNRHVVSNKDVQYTIVTNDGTEYDGGVVSIDPFNDLAVLQMLKKGDLAKPKLARNKLSGLPVVKLGDSDSLEIGQKVLAIGYALGEFKNTVTSGIISAKGRDIVANGGLAAPEQSLVNLLQTDAAINPGNSGGPLINLNGEVVGIDVATALSGSNIGFAIPINDVKFSVESVKKNGRIIRPELGVRHMILNKQIAEQLKLDIDHGALLVGDEAKGVFAVIPGGAADKAGLKIKDVILSVDGKDISEQYPLQQAIGQHNPGDTVTLKVWRSGATIDVKVKLDEAKDVAQDLRVNV